MKFRIAIFGAMLLLTVGCANGQIPSNPNIPSCPTANAVATWTALQTATTEVTGTTFNDSSIPSSAAGPYCYAVSSIINTSTPILESGASNIVLVAVPAGDSVDLSWTAPSSGPAPTGYIVYRTPAIVTVLESPTLGTPTVVAGLDNPGPTMAMNLKAEIVPRRNGH